MKPACIPVNKGVVVCAEQGRYQLRVLEDISWLSVAGQNK